MSSFGVILLNWNNSHETVPCLDSLFSAHPRPEHVIVVDNASTDNSISRISEWQVSKHLPPGWLTIVRSSTNKGFAGGNNLGIRYLRDNTDCSHIMLLNNDTEVASDFFARMSEALREHPDAGLATGTIYYHSDRSKIWYAGGYEVPFRALSLHHTHLPTSSKPVPTEFISGCTMVISREALKKLGELSEVYFPLYFEDAEYSYRARKAGFPVLYIPNAIVYHKVGATVGTAEASPRITYIQNKLRGFYVRRNYTGMNRIAATLYLLATKPARAIVTAATGNPKRGWAILKGTTVGLISPKAFK